MVEKGYALEFINKPPAFQGIRWSPDLPGKGDVLQEEIDSLLLKGAVEEVPRDQANEGFYSPLFAVPKKGALFVPL